VLDISADESVQLLFENKSHHAHLDSDDLFSSMIKILNISSQHACKIISKAQVPFGMLKAGFYARRDFPYMNLFNARYSIY